MSTNLAVDTKSEDCAEIVSRSALDGSLCRLMSDYSLVDELNDRAQSEDLRHGNIEEPLFKLR
jgi:hypothetical protein